MSGLHEPVLRREAIDHIAERGVAGNFVDATFGRGGHSRALLERAGPDARLLVLDRDAEAFACATELAAEDSRVVARRSAFGRVAEILPTVGMDDVQGAVMDLGLSSAQLDDPERGFSFRADGPLDMRMDQRTATTAADWLNEASVAEIASVIRRYGEERSAGRISRAIIAARPLQTTGELAGLVAANQARRTPGKHPATRVFQAIRIFINQELDELQSGLAGLFNALSLGGRLAVISFHSLEDRIVKRFCKARSSPPPVPRHVPIRAAEARVEARIVAGPVRPTAAEVRRNARARSAVLRVLERIA